MFRIFRLFKDETSVISFEITATQVQIIHQLSPDEALYVCWCFLFTNICFHFSVYKSCLYFRYISEVLLIKTICCAQPSNVRCVFGAHNGSAVWPGNSPSATVSLSIYRGKQTYVSTHQVHGFICSYSFNCCEVHKCTSAIICLHNSCFAYLTYGLAMI
jgi:hypothetical protein